MKWQRQGPETWKVGAYRVYRALLPQQVFFVSRNGKQPKRLESRDAVLELLGVQA